MLETQPSIFNEKEAFMLPPRRALLPWWIIFFCWIFIVICSLELIIKMLELFGTGYMDLSLFGIVAKTGLSIKETFSLANAIFSVVAAYALLKEKDGAINIAITNGLVSVVEPFVSLAEDSAEDFPVWLSWATYIFGWFMLIIYLWKLFSIRKDWNIRLPRRLHG